MFGKLAVGPDVASTACVARAARAVKGRVSLSDGDAPALAAWRRIADDDVAAGFDERASHAEGGAWPPSPCWMMYPLATPPRSSRMPARARRDCADGMSRGAGAASPPAVWPGRSPRGPAAAHAGARRARARPGAQPSGRRPRRSPTRSDGALEHGEEVWTDDRPRAPASAEAPELAVGAIVAHHPVELSHAREGRRRGGSGMVFRRGVQRGS